MSLRKKGGTYMSDLKDYARRGFQRHRYTVALKDRKKHLEKHIRILNEELIDINETIRLFKIQTARYKKKARVNRICRFCKKEFSITLRRVNKGQGIFCSLDCYNKYRKQKKGGD